ncbi:MAG: hypothetical protein M3N43_09750 [Actinomycetota bacterium]|nr:hypothetical protein [Actinomycetota bacterium]
MKEQIMFYQSPEYMKAVLADRERELLKMRMVRQARRARDEKEQTEGRRGWRIRLRDPLKA